MLPVLSFLWRVFLVACITASVAEIIDSINDTLMEGEIEAAEALLDELRERQDGDLESFYWEYRDRMTPETRALFERELGW